MWVHMAGHLAAVVTGGAVLCVARRWQAMPGPGLPWSLRTVPGCSRAPENTDPTTLGWGAQCADGLHSSHLCCLLQDTLLPILRPSCGRNCHVILHMRKPTQRGVGFAQQDYFLALLLGPCWPLRTQTSQTLALPARSPVS